MALPKKTFFNLSDGKRQRLMSAAYDEFSKMPLEEVSINVIIQQSDISRGSFYQYFEDKEDLYFYCLDLLKKDQNEGISNCFVQANGDVIEGLRLTFKFLYHYYVHSDYKQFYHHFFVNMSYRRSRNIFEKETEDKQSKDLVCRYKHLVDHIDQSSLSFSGGEELYEFVQYIFQMIHWTLSKVFLQSLSEEEAFRMINNRLSWLENGIRKK